MDRPSEVEILGWIKEVLGMKIDEKKENLMELLSSGVVLCSLINKFIPKKCNPVDSSVVFRRMENIEIFLKAAKEMGVPDEELFQSVDLAFPDRRNPKQVAICLYSLSRNIKEKFPGSKYRTIGPKLTKQNKRVFTQEQLELGEKMIRLQMGTNQRATQAGLGTGVRQITPECSQKK